MDDQLQKITYSLLNGTNKTTVTNDHEGHFSNLKTEALLIFIPLEIEHEFITMMCLQTLYMNWKALCGLLFQIFN